jgi:5-methylcytosine-specific restriction endonuclease McrA
MDVRRWLQRKASSMNSKARRLGVRGHVTPELLFTLGTTCHYCSVEVGYGHGSYDHVQAFDRGGLNTIDNIVRVCTSDQRRKFTKSVAQFEAHRDLVVTCALPGCTRTFHPRFAERERGMAKFCSRSHAAQWGVLKRSGSAV